MVKIHPADFDEAAKRACQTRLEDAKAVYPHVEEGNLPYICMDLVYQHMLLVVGFGKLHFALDPFCFSVIESIISIN